MDAGLCDNHPALMEPDALSHMPPLAPSAAPTFWTTVSPGDQDGRRRVTLLWKVTTWRLLIVWQSGCAVNLMLPCPRHLLSSVFSSRCLISWLTDKSTTTMSPAEVSGPSRWRSSTAAETYTRETRGAGCGSLSIDAPAIWRPPTLQGPHQKTKCGSVTPLRKVRNSKLTSSR